MLRLTITVDAEGESDLVDALNQAIEKIEDGFTTISLTNESVTGNAEVETLCEFCNSDGFIESESGKRKPCFNCNEPDHESD